MKSRAAFFPHLSRITHSAPWRHFVQLFNSYFGRRRKLVGGLLAAALLFSVARHFGAEPTSRDVNTSAQFDTIPKPPLKESNSPSDTSRTTPEVGGRPSGGEQRTPTVNVHQLIRQRLTPPSKTVGGLLQPAEPDRQRGGRGRRRRGGRRRGRRRRRGPRADHKTDYSQHGQSKFVDRHLSGRRDGFYVESGASDGETGSNSLFFELERNWTGLLVEGNPKSFASLLARGRRAWALNACLSPTGDMTTVRFRPAGGIGGIVDHMPTGHRKLVDKYGLDDVNVTCFAFRDVIAALPVSPPVARIDYWSLDVEGAELPILGTIKWSDFIPIDVISVEYKIKDSSGRTDDRETDNKLTALRQFFAGTGLYRELGTINGVDVVFGRIEHEQKHNVDEASQQGSSSSSSSSSSSNNNQANLSGSKRSEVEGVELEKNGKEDVGVIEETNGDEGGIEDGEEANDNGDDGGGGGDEDEDDGSIEDGDGGGDKDGDDGGGGGDKDGDDGGIEDGDGGGDEDGDDGGGGGNKDGDDGGGGGDEDGDDGGIEDGDGGGDEDGDDGGGGGDEDGDDGGIEDGGGGGNEDGDDGGIEDVGEKENENGDDDGEDEEKENDENEDDGGEDRGEEGEKKEDDGGVEDGGEKEDNDSAGQYEDGGEAESYGAENDTDNDDDNDDEKGD